MNAGIFVAIAMAGLTWYIIYHTEWGLRCVRSAETRWLHVTQAYR